MVNKTKTFYLETQKKVVLFVLEKNWTKIIFAKDDNRLLALINTEFFKNDYIRNYSKFLQYKKN